MKTILFLLAGSVLLSFSSCRKEASRACYSCKTETSNIANGMPRPLPPIPGLPGATDTSYCDRTPGDIETIERNGSSTQNINFAGVVVSSVQKTTCTKQ